MRPTCCTFFEVHTFTHVGGTLAARLGILACKSPGMIAPRVILAFVVKPTPPPLPFTPMAIVFYIHSFFFIPVYSPFSSKRFFSLTCGDVACFCWTNSACVFYNSHSTVYLHRPHPVHLFPIYIFLTQSQTARFKCSRRSTSCFS
jgi:hypothetical protein